MHYIQQHILDSLTFAESLRNRDMRPPRVESNLYQYHLQQLQKEGFVEKTDGRYRLTRHGLKYADKHSTSLKKERPQPKVVTIIFVVNERGELLIRTKQRQPFIGMLGLVFGKVHIGETLIDAAKREFVEKVNGDTDSLVFQRGGVAHFIIEQDDCIISDYIGVLVSVKVPNTIALEPFSAFYPLDSIPVDKLSPSTKELIDAYRMNTIFSEHTISAQKLN